MAEMDKETQAKIQELQILEQNFQALMMQKQQFQIEVNETKVASDEVGKSKGDVFRVLGQVMVKADKPSLKKELKEKASLLGKRMQAIEKQETSLREGIERIKADVLSKMQG